VKHPREIKTGQNSTNDPIARPIRPVLLAVAILGVLLPARPAHSQTKIPVDRKDQEIELLKSEVQQLEQRVETLEGIDQRVRVIDRKLDIQAESEHQKALEAPIIKASENGFSFASPQNDYKVNFGGIIQGDARSFTSGSDKNVGSTFFLNRVRPILSGTLWKYYDFNITPDFGQGSVVLQDAFLNFTYFPQAQLMAGKFKAPLDLERLQVDRDLLFSERGETINLVPNRDTGAQVHGDLFDQRLTYQLALMNGVPNNTASVNIDNNDGKDFFVRVFATPFKRSEYEWAKGLGLGFAASYGDERGNTISVYRTYGQSTWFSYNSGVTASGERTHLEPQAYYYWRSFGLLGEYVSDQHSLNRFLANQSTDRTDTFKDDGYMVQASWLLTGEDASYGWIKPHRPFDPRNGSWGAWEFGARLSNLSADPRQFKLGFASANTSAKTATEYALGINWYLSSNVKWQFDYARTFFNWGAGASGAVTDRPDESVFESQLQICF
jgi:phosphate-selective porin OprO/OprP